MGINIKAPHTYTLPKTEWKKFHHTLLFTVYHFNDIWLNAYKNRTSTFSVQFLSSRIAS